MKVLLKYLIFLTFFMILGLMVMMFGPEPSILPHPHPSLILTLSYFQTSHILHVPAHLEYQTLHDMTIKTFPQLLNETYHLAHPHHRKRLNERRWIDILNSNPTSIEIFVVSNVFSFSRSNLNLSLLPYEHATCRNINFLKPKSVYVHVHDEREKGNFTYDSDLPGVHLLKVKIKISSNLRRRSYYWFGNELFCEHLQNQDIHTSTSHCTYNPNRLDRFYRDSDIRWVIPNWETKDFSIVDMITATNVIATDDLLVCQNFIAMGGRCSFRERIEEQRDRIRFKRVVATYDQVFSISEFFGYWHLLGESLPRLAFFYEYLRNHTEFKIAVSSGDTSYQNWMNFLGFDWDRIIIKNKGPYRATRYLTSHMTPCEIPRRYEFLTLSNIVRSRLKQKRSKVKHILLLKRELPARRRIVNWEEVHEMLVTSFTDEKIMVLSDSKTDIHEVGNHWLNSKIVISVFGAGEANMLFADPGTTLIEITFSNYGPLYLRSAITLGLRFYGFLGTGKSHEIHVDVSKLKQVVAFSEYKLKI